MHDKDERAETFASWMIASGARLELPDPRRLSHLVALRDAPRTGARSSRPFTRLSTWFGRTAPLAAGPTATINAAACCVPA